MANPLAGVSKFVSRHRMPLLVGVGGLTAVAAFSKRGAAPPVSTTPLGPTIAGATGSEASALISQGAGLGLEGARLGLGTAERSLGLAEMATMGAQGLAGILAGSQAAVAGVAGSALGQVAGALVNVVTAPPPASYLPPPPPPTYSPPPSAPPPVATPPPVSAPMSLEHIVSVAFRNVLNRPAHPGDLSYWVGQMQIERARGMTDQYILEAMHRRLTKARDNGLR